MTKYTKLTWANLPATTSPTSAANFQHMEDGIESRVGSVNGVNPDSNGNVVVAAGASLTIKDENTTTLPQRSTLDFAGSGVTVTDGIDRTVVTIPGTTGGTNLEWLNVKAFGAVGNGTTEDTLAVQNACNAAVGTSTTNAKAVFFPPGKYLVVPFTIGHGTPVIGSGIHATTLVAKAGISNGAYLISNTNTTVRMISISNMRIQGNAAGQGANIVHGLKFDGGSGSGAVEYTDMRSQCHNVLIENFTGDAFTFIGRGACQISDCVAWNNKGNGFNVDIDSLVSNCDAGNCRNGFRITGNTQFSNCKAWWAGYYGSSIPAGVIAAGDGNGFKFDGVQSGLPSSSLIAQDCAAAGFRFVNCTRLCITSWVSDSNNNRASGTSHNVEIDNSYRITMIAGHNLDRQPAVNTGRPVSGLKLTNFSDINYIQFTTDSMLKQMDLTVPLYHKNVIDIDASGGGWNEQAFASTFIPDNTSGASIHVGTLTGNMTINAPKLNITSGKNITLLFTQDATGGRTITWNFIYRTYGWQPSPAPNSTSNITFAWDGYSGFWEKVAAHDPPTIPSVGSRHIIQNESVPIPDSTILNFSGSGVEAFDFGGETWVAIPGTTIKFGAATLPIRPNLKFIGSNVSIADNVTDDQTDITVINGGQGTFSQLNYVSSGTAFGVPFPGSYRLLLTKNSWIGIQEPPASLYNTFQVVRLLIEQDSVGGWTVAWSPGTIVWEEGDSPTIGTSPGSISLVELTYMGNNYGLVGRVVHSIPKLWTSWPSTWSGNPTYINSSFKVMRNIPTTARDWCFDAWMDFPATTRQHMCISPRSCWIELGFRPTDTIHMQDFRGVHIGSGSIWDMFGGLSLGLTSSCYASDDQTQGTIISSLHHEWGHTIDRNYYDSSVAPLDPQGQVRISDHPALITIYNNCPGSGTPTGGNRVEWFAEMIRGLVQNDNAFMLSQCTGGAANPQSRVDGFVDYVTVTLGIDI